MNKLFVSIILILLINCDNEAIVGSDDVTLINYVEFTEIEYSNNGIKPIKFAIKINKKYVDINGIHNFPSFSPIFGLIISFLRKSISISNKLDIPLGVALIFFLYRLVPYNTRLIVIPETIHSIMICFVMENQYQKN